jgi:hypothetical protein
MITNTTPSVMTGVELSGAPITGAMSRRIVVPDTPKSNDIP